MKANRVNSLKGPALLAKAGVSLADARWLYAQRVAPTSSAASTDVVRFDEIKLKVKAFLQGQVAIAHARRTTA